jgi:hypothetical protein
MTSLPAIPDLIHRAKALAALELILSPEWEYRYYSFNANWSPSEQMASMRDGSGDEWWLVFHADGWAALKGLAHESEAWSKDGDKLSAELRAVMPPEVADFAREPAFRWDSTSFAYFYLSSKQRWRRVNDLTIFSALDAGEDELLRHLCGSASDYASFAADYYERPVPVDAVAEIFGLRPIADHLVSSLNSDVTLKDITDELHNEIGYPR